jgi:hypothetical protein
VSPFLEVWLSPVTYFDQCYVSKQDMSRNLQRTCSLSLPLWLPDILSLWETSSSLLDDVARSITTHTDTHRHTDTHTPPSQQPAPTTRHVSEVTLREPASSEPPVVEETT